MYGNEYDVHEMMGDLSEAVFSADLNGSANSIRQNLQQEYVDRLIGVFSTSGFDHVAKSAALSSLKSIQTMISGAGEPDASTEAHRGLLLHKIEHALDP